MKRKLHGMSYYQCDYTGFLMHEPNCYLPTWQDGKLKKKGHYCNWEAVLAHATIMKEANTLAEEELAKIKNYIMTLLGLSEERQAIFLQHVPLPESFAHLTDGEITETSFHQICNYNWHKFTAVNLPVQGQPFSIILAPCDGVYDGLVTSFECVPLLQGNLKSKDFEFRFFGEDSTKPLNPRATALCKCNMYGSVMIVRCTKEASYLLRQRNIDYTAEQFEADFTKTRKRMRKTEPTPLEPKEYAELKEQMAASLQQVEENLVVDAVVPAKLARAAKVPPPDGKALARLLKLEARMTDPAPPASPGLSVDAQ